MAYRRRLDLSSSSTVLCQARVAGARAANVQRVCLRCAPVDFDSFRLLTSYGIDNAGERAGHSSRRGYRSLYSIHVGIADGQPGTCSLSNDSRTVCRLSLQTEHKISIPARVRRCYADKSPVLPFHDITANYQIRLLPYLTLCKR